MSLARVLFILVLIVAATIGCAHRSAPPNRLPDWVFVPGHTDHPRPRAGIRGRSESSDFVVAALQQAGLRFGTDGTVPSLWQYLKNAHPEIPAQAARPGDVLVFRVAPVATREENPCETPDDVAIVSDVDDSGRISFVEARHGRTVFNYLDPLHPRTRRDDGGQVRNSFLRVAHPSDPVTAPLLAGEMLCGVARPLG
jgi:hypothetical protein